LFTAQKIPHVAQGQDIKIVINPNFVKPEMNVDRAPLVSIIIPTYNRSQWLTIAIESALHQTYQPIEVIVVSDGPLPEDTRHLLVPFKKIRIIEQEHRGAGQARNTGFLASRGQWIQFLDDDDWLLPEAVEQKIIIALGSPGAGIVYSDIFLAEKDGSIISTHFLGWKRPLPQGNLFELLAKRNFLLVHSPLWRRDVFEQTGGFPARTGSEDWEVLVCAAEFALFSVVDKPLGVYRLHHMNISLDHENQRLGDGKTQLFISSTPSFRKLDGNVRARLLIGFSFQQWREGNSKLGLDFYSQAKRADPHHPYLIILRILMLLGRRIVGWMMKIIWRIRNWKRFSSGYYFLTKSK